MYMYRACMFFNVHIDLALLLHYCGNKLIYLREYNDEAMEADVIEV